MKDGRLRVCVYGAGAIGGHFAARLLEARVADVSLVARGAHLDAIRDRGLTLLSDGAKVVTRPAVATDDPSSLPPQDLVVVTLKTTSQPGQAEAIEHLLAPEGCALFVSNGIPWWWPYGLRLPQTPMELLDPEGALWDTLGPEKAIGCVVYSTNEVIEPGLVIHRASNKWIIGEPDGSNSLRLRTIAALLLPTALNVTITTDIRKAIWQKLLLNASVNTVTALTRLHTSETSRDADLRRVKIALLCETLAVANALGWDLRAETHVDALIKTYWEIPNVQPSMLQDVLACRPLEVEALLGQVNAFAKEAHVPTPTIDTVLPILRGLDRANRGSYINPAPRAT